MLNENAHAQALPAGGQVTAGAGSITQPAANALLVRQSTDKLAINWQSFNIGAGNSVRFEQPSASSIALNRVLGTNRSEIYGNLSANGQVFLLNPNGILFGRTAQVDVGGLVATTLKLSDRDFMDGRLVLSEGEGTAAILNEGTLRARNGGYLALIGNRVANQGTMEAYRGSVVLGAGGSARLTLADSRLVSFEVTQGALDALAENGGLIRANGGQVILTAGARDSLLASTVNNAGVIEAQTVERQPGNVLLLAGMQAGTTMVGGTIDASAPVALNPGGGDGGAVETSAAQVQVAPGAVVTTRAEPGSRSGTWLIDPTNFTVAAGAATQSASGIGAATLSAALDAGNVSIATSAASNGADQGDILVNSGVSWSGANSLTLTAHRDINFNAGLTYSGSGVAGLTARAARDISVASGVAIAATGTGSLPVVFNSYTSGLPSGTGEIRMESGSSITTNGGSIVFGGGSDPALNPARASSYVGSTLSGIRLDNATLSAGAGIVSLRGIGLSAGVTLKNGATVSSTSGNITLVGSGDVNGGGISMSGAGTRISTVDGNISLTGTGLSSVSFNTNPGIALDSASIVVSGLGRISLAGTGGGSAGITLRNNFSALPVLQTVGGDIDITATGGLNNGLDAAYYGIAGTIRATGAGNIRITGTAAASNSRAGGIYLQNTAISSAGGDIVLHGTSNAGAFASHGVLLGASSASTSGAGNVEVIGTGGTGSGGGTGVAGSLVTLQAAGGSVLVSGTSYGTDSASNGISGSALNVLNSGTGAITIVGDATETAVTGGSRPAGLANFFRSGSSGLIGGSGYSGDITIRSSAGVDMNGNRGAMPITTTGRVIFQATRPDIGMSVQTGFSSVTAPDDFWLSGNTLGSLTAGYSELVLGSAVSTAPLTLRGTSVFSNPVTLLAGSGGISLAGSLNSSSTVSMQAGSGGINLGGAISGVSTLTLQTSGGGVVGGSGSLDVAKFDLVSGDYFQVGALGSFRAPDFRYNGTFLRALGGDGSSASPYRIADVYGLQGMATSSLLSKRFLLANDIDASVTATWNSDGSATPAYAGFRPIGDSGTPFIGGLDGANHVIDRLTINRPSTNEVGLFGSTGSAFVSNLGLDRMNVTGASSVGGIAGRLGGTLSGSYASGSLTGTVFTAGGLVGTNTGLIDTSYSNVAVNGGVFVGGLAGNNAGRITTTYASGSVSGSSSVGGLVGINSGTVTSSYWNIDSTGQSTSAGGTGLSATQFLQAGSFAGWDIAKTGGSSSTWRIYEGNTAPLLRAHLTPLNLLPDFQDDGAFLSNVAGFSIPGGTDLSRLLGTSDFTGALNLSSSGVADNYLASLERTGRYSNQRGYDITTTRVIASPGSAPGDIRFNNGISARSGTVNIVAAGNIDLNGTSLQLANFGQMGQLVVQAGGSIVNAGTVAANFTLAGGFWDQVGIPVLSFSSQDFRITGGTFLRAVGGTGGATDPYMILDEYGLQGMGSGSNLSRSFKLYTSVGLSSTQWNGGAGFRPIGSAAAPFTGSFDGDGNTIGPLYIQRPAEDNVGLFGVTRGARIANLTMSNVTVSGANAVGAIAGTFDGTLSNVSIHSDFGPNNILGTQNVGGLVGINTGTVTNARVRGGGGSSVIGSGPGTDVGGLVGANAGTVAGSSVSGALVVGNQRVGGIFGTNSGAVSNSYVAGQSVVDGSAGVGADVGGLAGLNSGAVTNTYSEAAVSGNTRVGGLVGTNNGTVVTSYASGSVTGSVNVGGLVGTGTGTVSLSVWNTDSTGVATSAGGTGRDSSAMMQPGSFAGWNLSTTGGSNAVWRLYGGSTAPLLRSFLDPYSLPDAPDISVRYNGAYHVANSTADFTPMLAIGTGRNVGAYSSVWSGQEFGFDFIGGNLTITPAPLTISNITASNKTYDGTTSATVSTASATYTGLVAGDALTVNVTGTFGDKNGGTGKTVTLASSYTGADVVNYTITNQASTTANITAKALTVGGITAADKTYDGTTAATVSTTGATYTGLLSGDAVTVSATGTFTNKNAGPGKTVTLASSYTGADVSNYSITDQASTTANIAGKALTIVGITASNKTYDGTTSATVSTTGATYAGLIAGDALTVNATGTFSDKNVGTGKAVTLASSYTGADVGNYSITNQSGTTANIGTKALTVGGITAADKTYDGTASATVSTTGASYTGLVAGDALTVNATGTFGEKNVGTGKTVTLASSYTGADLGNYTITNQAGTTANISARALTIGGITASDRVYDGTTSATVNTVAATYAGLVSGDAVSVAATGAFGDKNVGTAKTVTLASSYAGADVGNYAITNQATTTASISPRSLTISGILALPKSYDGNNIATNIFSTNAAYTGLIAGDAVTVGATGTYSDKNAGSGKTVTLTSSYTGADVSNYSITSQASAVGRINAAVLTIGGIAASDKVYDGNTSALVSTAAATYTGLISGDAVTVNATGAFADKNVGIAKTVTLTSSYTGADVANYRITSQPDATATISPKALTVGGITATGKTYDGTTSATVSTSAATYAGLIAGDAVTVNATGTFGDKDAGTGKTVTLASSYAGADVSNYSISSQATATASINAKAATVTALDATKTYGSTYTFAGTEFSATGVVTGDLIDRVTLASTGAAPGASVAGSPYAIQASGAAGASFLASNYSLTYVPGRLGVDPKLLSVIARPLTKVADGLPVFGGNGVDFSGFANGETTGVLGGNLTYAGSAQGAVSAGTYQIIPGGFASSNYAIRYVPGVLSIDSPPLVSSPVVLAALISVHSTTSGGTGSGTGSGGTGTARTGSQSNEPTGQGQPADPVSNLPATGAGPVVRDTGPMKIFGSGQSLPDGVE